MAVNAPIIQPLSLPFPPEMNPPINKERNEIAVISQLNDDSSSEVAVNKSETAKLVRSMAENMAIKP